MDTHSAKTFRTKTPAFLILVTVLVVSLLQIQISHGAAYTVQYDPTIAAIIGQVNQNTLYTYVANLSGVQAVTIGGTSYTIRTRNTGSGTPVQKTTQYVYEYMQSLPGLDSVTYDTWSAGGYSNRNVVGVLTGTVRPTEIVLLVAHIDDMPGGTTAPGADDNASGAAALMMAAKLLSPYTFERTIRFVVVTGEEQNLYGSADYANAAYAAGENIVAVVNMDMLGWESDGSPTMRVHTRPPSTGAKDLEIANLFVSVVNTYSIGLTPIVTSYGMDESDHYSFWAKGYPAICVIEDDGDLQSEGDFNPYYHTTSDTLSRLKMPYFTDIVEATVGSVAHLSFLDDGTPGATSTPTLIPTPTSTPGTVSSIIVNPVLRPAPGSVCSTGWYKVSGGGFNQSSLYLTTNVKYAVDSYNSGRWTPNIPTAGRYKVEAYVGRHGTVNWSCPTATVSRNTSYARYSVQHAGGKTVVRVNQYPLSNQWVGLGTYTFAAGKYGYVVMNDITGEADATRLLVFNVLRFTYVGP
jgi:hypothetical protein